MKRTHVVLVGILLSFVAGLVPYETVLLPKWKMRIVDEDDQPYPNLQATQVWKNYSLEVGSGGHEEIRYTDQNGYVDFPERRIRASVLWRLVSTAFSFLTRLAHGGFGLQAYVFANGPDGYADVHYSPGKPIPEKLVLRSRLQLE